MIVRAFSAIRPAPEYAALVAALPYDVMSLAEAKLMAKGNPYSFLRVDRAEIDLTDGVDPYGEQVYKQAQTTLNEMMEQGVFKQDEEPCLYIYRLTRDGRSQTGVVTCVGIDDYWEGRIKKHELTREDKERDRIRHVDACNAHTGPVFLIYRAQADIAALVKTWQAQKACLYAFKADDGVYHEVWRIDNRVVVERLEEAFGCVEAFYIADGHHRMAAAAQVCWQRRQTDPDYSGEEGFNYALAVVFPDDQMRIMAYNRLVRDLNGLTAAAFWRQIEEALCEGPRGGRSCQLSMDGDTLDTMSAGRPSQPRCVGMYLAGTWSMLNVPAPSVPNDPVEALDVSLLQNRILGPVLGIHDPRRDQRIDFVGGIRGLHELERRVDSGEMAVAFALYPVSIAELLRVSDAGRLMPPKSTWFEPKLRSGLFVHGLA
ncbi:MAG: DUF1015 family protein [Gracilibacteraceae bacterium]|jgi:uncharacterized protein (DUF1015 family)|nr:DUF1015 family protein [Gracilibacteraceae bacterium]